MTVFVLKSSKALETVCFVKMSNPDISSSASADQN